MTQPVEMKTRSYVYGVEKLNGHDAWALFQACALGDGPKVKSLVAKDPRLVNAQYWYQLPLHFAVRAGHAEIVKYLLDYGADPGQSRYTYYSWDKLLRCARDRGYARVEVLLRQAMRARFNYSPDFEVLKDAIISRNMRRISAVLRRQPKLVRASDALGNNALHWSVMTRQLELIGWFAGRGTPLDAHRADGQTPVLLAVHGASDYWYRAGRGRSDPSLRNTSVMTGYLLARGAHYCISVATAVGDQERVEQLLREDPARARRLDAARVSPLSHAAREGHLHLVRLLLDRGADPNLPEDGAPYGLALWQACCRNHLEIAQLLLEHGANPNAGVDSCECCLTIGTVYHGDRAKPLQQVLRRYGASMPPYRMTGAQLKRALRDRHPAIRHEEFFSNVMRTRDAALLDLYLRSHPPAVKEMQGGGSGICPGTPAMARVLLARGLDSNRPDWLGRTMLHECAANGHRGVAALFLKAGADINARELEFNATPLAMAVRSWCAEENPAQAENRRRMVEFLLERGAAPNLPGDESWATPLACAVRHARGEIVALLKQYGAR
jgi:ankyrin repeat protein